MNAPYFIYWSLVMSLVSFVLGLGLVAICLLIRYYGERIAALLQQIRDTRAANDPSKP